MSTIRDLKVETTPVSALKPYVNNARTHSKRQVRQIANSITQWGWINPIIVDADNLILAGKGRWDAAQLLGIKTVPTIRIGKMTEAQKRAYIIADNKLALNAGWDSQLLAIEFNELVKIDPAFDPTLTGFDMGEIDVLIGETNPEAIDKADLLPKLDPSFPPVTQPGDLWRVGWHRLICTDAREARAFESLMVGEHAAMAFADPPYNVRIDGHASGLASEPREFAMASGEMDEAEFIAFLKRCLGLTATHTREGAIHFVCMDWRHLYELLTAGRDVYHELKNICVWAKTSAGMGSLYRSQHECVAVFKKGSARHINNVELGRQGRYRTNVWSYPGMNSFGAERSEALAMHPTVKPVALVKDAILDCSNRGDIVLDPFVGSGTTLVAAEMVGRRVFGIEIDPQYVDVALRRFRTLTGVEPVHALTGLTFTETEEARSQGQKNASKAAANGQRRFRRRLSRLAGTRS